MSNNISGDCDESFSSGKSCGEEGFDGSPIQQQQASSGKRKRNPPGNPDPSAEVVALSPTTLMATNRFVCEICHKGFQRDQNLQLHRRGHNLPWKLRKRTSTEIRKRVYICPEPSCIHHNPARALGDLTGIKKHYSRKHGEKKWQCEKCSKKYAVKSDWKAHLKTCGTKEYQCDCGTIFSRRDSFVTHRAFCDAIAVENNKVNQESSTRPLSSSKVISTSISPPELINHRADVKMPPKEPSSELLMPISYNGSIVLHEQQQQQQSNSFCDNSDQSQIISPFEPSKGRFDQRKTQEISSVEQFFDACGNQDKVSTMMQNMGTFSSLFNQNLELDFSPFASNNSGSMLNGTSQSGNNNSMTLDLLGMGEIRSPATFHQMQQQGMNFEAGGQQRMHGLTFQQHIDTNQVTIHKSVWDA